MRKFLSLMTLAAGTVALAATASAQQLELKFGHVGSPGSLFDATAVEFAKRANEKLGDKAKVTVFGSSQLGGDQDLLQKLKLGQVNFSLPSTVMSSVSPEFGVFEMPYLIRDREHMKKAGEATLETVFQPAAKAKGYRIIGLVENGFRHITNNARPIVKPEDLKGLKLRTPKGAWRVKMFQAYGANPTPMSLKEVFTALQTGVMDGQENPFPQIHSQKFQEVQKYLSLSGHVYTPGYILVSDEHFSQLPEDVQAILLEVGSGMQDWVYEKAAELDAELLKDLEAKMEVNEVDKDAFITASAVIYDEFASEVDGGADLVKSIQALAQ